MAKPVRSRKDQKHKSFHNEHLPLARENFMIIGAGFLVIVFGYLAMIDGPVEGFLPLVAAPVLLVAGYCGIIPLGIIYRKGMFKRARQDGSRQPVSQG